MRRSEAGADDQNDHHDNGQRTGLVGPIEQALQEGFRGEGPVWFVRWGHGVASGHEGLLRRTKAFDEDSRPSSRVPRCLGPEMLSQCEDNASAIGNPK